MQNNLYVEPEFTGKTVLEYSREETKVVNATYRKCELPLPGAINHAPGISIFGRVLKSFLFSTNPYIIRNTNADAVLALAPFTCQLPITDFLIRSSERPVFVGVAGSITNGTRSIELARAVEAQGAHGVVISPGADLFTIEGIRNAVDIPVIVSLCDTEKDSLAKIDAGASIINVAAGSETCNVIRKLRLLTENLPIIATGGNDTTSINSTIAAGADAISWTPPSITELEKQVMAKSRIKNIPA